MAGRVPAIGTAWYNLLDKVWSGSDRLKQASRIHHRDTKKKPGDDFSRTYRLRFSFSDSLCLCVSVPLCLCASVPLCLCASVPLCLCGESFCLTYLLEPVGSRPHLIKQIIIKQIIIKQIIIKQIIIKQIIPCGADGRAVRQQQGPLV
jgi:hypothetical protein